MRKRFVTGLLMLAICILPLCAGRTIATATLRVTLYVPPEPITEETAPGVYDGYTLGKDDSTVYVTAL